MMRLARCSFVCAVCPALLSAFSASAQPYPAKPIRIISPNPPGGSTTVMARLVGQKLTERWGQPVIIDNRPGGNSVIGTEAMVKSAPDGYTFLVGSNSLLTSQLLVPNFPFDAFRDFATVATLASSEYILVLNPSVPAGNLQEFIALAKARPGQLNYATAGTGNTPHLVSELLNIAAGIKMQHIPYKGGSQVVTDLMGGQVHLAVQPPIFAMTHIKAGKLRAIAITGETRLAALPELPTFREAGLAGIDVKSWWGLLAPVGTAKTVIGKLSAEIGGILTLPDSKEKMASQGLDALIATPEQMTALMKADMARYAQIIKAANIKLEQ